MHLTELFATDAAAVAEFASLENACHAADAPWMYPSTPYRVEMEMRHSWDGEPGRYFLAYDDSGRVVGGVTIDSSDYDNLELAWLGIKVYPEHRRRGHGTAMLDQAIGLCREMGRPLLGLDGWDNDATHGFAAAVGFEPKSQAICRRQVLTEIDKGAVEAMYADSLAQAGDYELDRICGYTPEDLLAELAESTSAINDAPTDDLEYEDEVFTPERVRAYETAQIEGGHRFYRILARHRASGELGGLSVVVVDTERPANGKQHDTSVVGAHRGHRLGLLLKADMLRWLAEAEPQLRTIDTWNAESNDHMIAVNEHLGYRVMRCQVEFQRRL